MERKIKDLIEQYEARLVDMEDDALATGWGKIVLLQNVVEDLKRIINSL